MLTQKWRSYTIFLSKETAERRFWLDGDLGADGNEVPAGVYSRGNHKGPIRFEQEMIGWEEIFMIELMGPLMLPGRISWRREMCLFSPVS